jgi:hypothetical protein
MKRAMILIAAILVTCRDERADDTAGFDQLSVVSEETWASAGTLTCRFQAARWCSPEGCEDTDASTFVRWTPATSTFERCDERGCDRYRARVSYSGAFANIALPENGALARLSANGTMLEVSTSFHSALVRHGRCG